MATSVNDGFLVTREEGGWVAMSAVNTGTCVAALAVKTAKSVVKASDQSLRP